MKFCKKCGCLYVTEVCPKCGITIPEEPAEQRELTDEEQKEKKRNWIGILIGFPAFIGVIYLIIYIYSHIGQH